MDVADNSPVCSPNNMPAINELLQQGRYRIIQPLGQNGTGLVYQAYDNALKTNVAFKEIPVDLKKAATVAQQETLKRTFAGEAKILAEIRHESLVSVQGYFSEADRHYLVTELVDGNNLSELMEKNKTALPLADVANWAEQLLDALHYLHTQTPPIIHRDIKPQNVKLTLSGKIKLALGITPNADAESSTAPNSNQSFSAAHLHYLPLEQILGSLDSASQKVITNSYDEKSERILEQPPDAKSDIYALGATLYHLLTARLPVDALERSIDVLEGKTDPLLPPSQVNPAIPREISDLLMKALEIKRENRFDSAIIMRQAWRTAFVRVKERAAEGAPKQEEDLLEIPFAEYKQSEPESATAEPVNLEIETENTRQMDLIKERLREAEAKRLEAERRAAEAEKLLFEKNTRDLSVNQSSPTVKSAQDSAQTSQPASVSTVTTPTAAAQEQSADEFKDLFAAPPKDNKILLRMSAAAGILVILCGAAWGVWFMLNSKSAESNQMTSSPTMSLTETLKPAPTVEASPAPSVEATPETGAIQTTDSSVESAETTVTSPASRNKPLAPPTAKVKKQTLPSAKTPAAKKPVTVDDLINDN